MNLSPETYRDRVYGCWAGKCLAGAIGMPFEGVSYQPALRPETITVLDVPNDDLELQLVWLIALERHGLADNTLFCTECSRESELITRGVKGAREGSGRYMSLFLVRKGLTSKGDKK